MTIYLEHYLVLAVLLFSVGLAGSVIARNVMTSVLSLSFMFMAGVIAVISFARWNLMPEGKLIAAFIIIVWTAYAALGAVITAKKR